MNRMLFSVLVMLIASVANAGLTFTELKQLTADSVVLEGQFQQEKYLNALDASIISSGYFVYQKNKKLRWVTVKPIENELIMTPVSLINKQGGKELVKIDFSDSPTASLLNEILFSLLTANWETLSTLFSVSGMHDGTKWQAVLNPVNDIALQLVEKVDLSGGERLRAITLYELTGDQTIITFHYPLLDEN